MKLEKNFTTILDRDICGNCIYYKVSIYHKNGKQKETRQYSSSFNLDEIYEEVSRLYPHKTYKLTIILRD